MCAGVTVHASAGSWQLPQERPLDPRLAKKALERSMSPFLLNVRACPVAFAKGVRFAMWSPAETAIPATSVVERTQRVFERESLIWSVLCCGAHSLLRERHKGGCAECDVDCLSPTEMPGRCDQ